METIVSGVGKFLLPTIWFLLRKTKNIKKSMIIEEATRIADARSAI